MNYSITILLVAAASLAAATPRFNSPRAGDLVAPRPETRTTGRTIVRLHKTAKKGAFDRTLKDYISSDTSAGPTDNKLVYQYTKGINGYAGYFTDAVIEQLRNNPSVAGIEEDAIGYIEGVKQGDAPWGLNRVSQRKLDLTKGYDYPDTAGEGITAYVIDTGVDASHSEFNGRATLGVNFVTSEPAEDLNGHGTHVSGTIVGQTYGIAKKAKVVGVKVCTGSGSCATSDVIAGIQYVIKNATRNKAVVNISLGLAASDAIDAAVKEAVDAGIFISVSGGNANTDSCLNSPRRAPESFAVGASDRTDKKASFSNYGKCLKVFAPGHQITSSIPGNKNDTWSGTSMASPHVAGVGALYLAEKKYETIYDLHKDLIARSTKNIITNAPGNTTTNLIYSLPVGGDDDVQEPAKPEVPTVPVPTVPVPTTP